MLFALAMRSGFAIGLALALSFVVASASALAAEAGTDESRAGQCEALDGLPFVFCVAFCEARQCDSQAPDDPRCRILAEGFARVTGGDVPPCGAASPDASI